MTKFYCTYFDRNYLAKSLALIESLKKQETNDFKIICLCLDESSRLVLKKLNMKETIPVPLHLLEIGDIELLEAKKNRTTVEYYWTLTPTFLLRILEGHPEIEMLTYLDADLYFFSSPDPIFAELNGHSVLIHEHRFSNRLKYLEDNGRFNVGLIVFNNERNSIDILRWWRERCIEWCFKRLENGKMGDQKYLDSWPSNFSGVSILKHIGAGLAPWNHEQYTFSVGSDGCVTVDDFPVIFYHFHSLIELKDNVIVPMGHLTYSLPIDVLNLLFIPYAEALLRARSKIRKILPEYTPLTDYSGKVGVDHTYMVKGQENHSGDLDYRELPARILAKNWICYCSKQISCNVSKDSQEFFLWHEGKKVNSENDLILELQGRVITKRIETIYVIGAYLFEERELIFKLLPNLKNVFLFEPIPKLFQHLLQITEDDSRIRVFPFAISGKDCITALHITNNFASSSLLPLGKHKQIFPHVKEEDVIKVECKTLTSVIEKYQLAPPDMLFLDVQGAEYDIISSIPSNVLATIKLLYTEASMEELYLGSRPLNDLISILEDHYHFVGFAPLTNETPTHGNAMFVNKHELKYLEKEEMTYGLPIGERCDLLNQQSNADGFGSESTYIDSEKLNAKYGISNREFQLRAKPDSFKISYLNKQGEDFYEKGDVEGALQAFTTALNIDPCNMATHNNLAALYYKTGHKDRAQVHFEKCAQLKPGNINFQKNLADFYFVELNRIEEAMQIYKRALVVNPKDVETLLITGNLCVALKRFDEATTFYQKVLDIEPENKEATQIVEKLQNISNNTMRHRSPDALDR